MRDIILPEKSKRVDRRGCCFHTPSFAQTNDSNPNQLSYYLKGGISSLGVFSKFPPSFI